MWVFMMTIQFFARYFVPVIVEWLAVWEVALLCDIPFLAEKVDQKLANSVNKQI